MCEGKPASKLHMRRRSRHDDDRRPARRCLACGRVCPPRQASIGHEYPLAATDRPRHVSSETSATVPHLTKPETRQGAASHRTRTTRPRHRTGSMKPRHSPDAMRGQDRYKTPFAARRSSCLSAEESQALTAQNGYPINSSALGRFSCSISKVRRRKAWASSLACEGRSGRAPSLVLPIL